MIFSASLETSQSVGARTGWQPLHLLAEDADGTLVGAVPCYVKSHSRANMCSTTAGPRPIERAGGRYYPKLQVSVPFTPATGRRLLVRPGAAGRRRARRAGRCADRHLPALRRLLGPRHLPDRAGMAACSASAASCKRTDQQFHWENAGYGIVRRFPRRARLAQAQDHPARARGRAGRRHQRALADRRRSHRERVGRVLRLLHGDRLAQMGTALSHARRSFRWSARTCATASCW